MPDRAPRRTSIFLVFPPPTGSKPAVFFAVSLPVSCFANTFFVPKPNNRRLCFVDASDVFKNSRTGGARLRPSPSPFVGTRLSRGSLSNYWAAAKVRGMVAREAPVRGRKGSSRRAHHGCCDRGRGMLRPLFFVGLSAIPRSTS